MNTTSRRSTFALAALTILASATSAQDSGSMFSKFQFHGNLTQGFIYGSSNNYLSTDSSDGSLKWTEGTLSLSRPIDEHLRVGAQVHSYRLGLIGRQRVTLDWAYADYKPSRHFGIRAGKVKTPTGLFNDVQDVDAVYPWVLLPQSLYSADLRGFMLAHTGAVAYGEIASSKALGSIEYQVFGGRRSQSRIEGFSTLMEGSGIALGDCSGPSGGVDVRWRLPLEGLMVGATYSRARQSAPDSKAYGMVFPVEVSYSQPQFYAQYEKDKLSLSAEWRIGSARSTLGPAPQTYSPTRAAYVMASYRLLPKLSVGTYYGTSLGFYNANRDRSDPRNYQKDLAINSRVDVNRYVYFKAEGHFMAGVQNGFYPQNNPNGLEKNTNLFLAKVGFTF